MQIDRKKKEAIVAEFQDKFSKAEATFLADYSGIHAEGITELRNSLRDVSVEFKILRNTLARLAVKGTKAETLSEHFKGTTAVAFTYTDPASAAKVLTAYAKADPNLKIRIGTLQDKVIDLNKIKQLSALPSREELVGKLLGVLNNVPRSLVGVLSGVPRKLVYALNAIGQSKEGSN